MGVDDKSSMKHGSSNKFVNFFIGIKAEIKRITWASKKDTKKALIVVLVFCLVWIVLVSAMDFGFDNFFGKFVFKTS